MSNPTGDRSLQSDVSGLTAARMQERLAEIIEQSKRDVGLQDILTLIDLASRAQAEVNLMTFGVDSFTSTGTGLSAAGVVHANLGSVTSRD